MLLLTLFAASASGSPAIARRRPAYAPHQVIIRFKATTTAAQKAWLGKRLGIVRGHGLGMRDTCVFQLNGKRSVLQAVSIAKASGLTRYSEANGYMYSQAITPNDPDYPAQGYLPQINAPEAWETTTGSSSTLIAVVDTGIDTTAPDLSSQIWNNPNPGFGGYPEDVDGWNFAENNNNVTDTYGHGSWMSGIIGATGNNGIGVTGVDWDATLMPVKAGATGTFLDSNIASGINFAIANGAKIVNLSLGGDYSSVIAAAMEGHENTLFVAAAGNNSSDNDGTPFYPCNLSSTYRNVICVAAVDENNQLASFSDYGPEYVDLAAPGVDDYTTGDNGEYTGVTGTSPATAVVSGVAGLMASIQPNWTAEQLKAGLMSSVKPIAELSEDTLTGGMVDAAAAVEVVPPVTTFTQTPPADGNNPEPVFGFSADQESTFQCQVDGTAWFSCESGEPVLPALSDGSHTFKVKATNEAGDIGVALSDTFEIDTVAPVVQITSGPAPVEHSSSASFQFNSNDPTATLECSLAESPEWGSCASGSLEVTGLEDGEHTFQVRSIDPAGNVSTIGSWTWISDTRPLVTTINSHPAPLSNVTDPSFSFSSNKSDVSYQCRLDEGPWKSCSSPELFPGQSEGQQTLEVRGSDPAGDIEASPPSYSWTIELRPPVTTLTAKPKEDSNLSDPSFSFTANEAASFQCRLDFASWRSCSSPVSFPGLSDGSHTLQVQATDAAGNVETTPLSYAWKIDTVIPQSAFTEIPEALSSDTSASFSFISSEAEVSYLCDLDNNGWQVCSNPVTFSGLTPGLHTIEVKAIDSAGNEEAVPLSYRWTIEAPAPAPQITTPITPDERGIGSPPQAEILRHPRRHSGAKAVFVFSGASDYQYRLRGRRQGAWISTFKPRLRLRLKPGHYQLQLRGLSAQLQPGPVAVYSFTVVKK